MNNIFCHLLGWPADSWWEEERGREKQQESPPAAASSSASPLSWLHPNFSSCSLLALNTSLLDASPFLLTVTCLPPLSCFALSHFHVCNCLSSPAGRLWVLPAMLRLSIDRSSCHHTTKQLLNSSEPLNPAARCFAGVFQLQNPKVSWFFLSQLLSATLHAISLSFLCLVSAEMDRKLIFCSVDVQHPE